MTNTTQPHARGDVAVVIAVEHDSEALGSCLESVRAHTPGAVEIVTVTPSPPLVNRALEELARADVVVISAPCAVGPGWLERLREVARGDSNTATASALADRGTALALGASAELETNLHSFAIDPSTRSRALHPRISRAVGPCVYVRREAIELVGALDEELELAWALEIDFAQRCVLCGLGHVAADNVVVRSLSEATSVDLAEMPAPLARRYPHLRQATALGESDMLALALQAARGHDPLSVTLDARVLGEEVTGTHVHIVELIRALAQTDELTLRVVIERERIDGATLAVLRTLPSTDVLFAEDLNSATPRTTIFHRPQQTFSPGDVALAVDLGERFVLSQLDLIAYRNPGYFADGDAWEDYRRASRHGLTAAERVVVFSRHTYDELLADALVGEKRIAIVPPGLDHRGTQPPQQPDVAPGEGFLLCLGTDFLHKNRLFALRLLAALKEEHGWPGSLVLAGRQIDRGSSRELERAFMLEHPELRDSVLTLGSVSEAEKAWLIAHAGAVVYPSVYEGFGLVPFEAALSGVPCVFAPQASLAEVASHGTATIVPWDPTASAAAAHALLTDESARAQHLAALAEAARSLTWAATASAMVEIYRQAAVAPVRDGATLSRDAVQRERRLSVEHELEAARLVAEREHARAMYDELNAEVGFALGLIGPHGSLPEGLQRALLALSARPRLSRPLFGILAHAFVLARALGRVMRSRRGDRHQ